MTHSDIQKLDNTICKIQEATAKNLEVLPVLFGSRARDEEEKRFYTKIAEELPDLREDVSFLTTLSFSDSVDDKYFLSYMIGLAQELSDRFIALKVLVDDLVPILTVRDFSYREASAFFPYLSVLLDQIEGVVDALSMWYEEHFDRLYDRFEYDLSTDENFLIIRNFVDRSLAAYAERNGDDRNIDTVRSFHEYAINALDRYAGGDDDVRFTYSFELDADCEQPSDVEKAWIEFRIDGSIDVSMSDYVTGLCGGDSELLWSYSLYGNGESIGVNGLSEHNAEEIGKWKLNIEYPDEFYYYEGAEDEGDIEESKVVE